MGNPLSTNTQAILLLTAPLLAGRIDPSPDLLTPGEYKKFARFLREKQRQPADFLALDVSELLDECNLFIDGNRLKRLLARGFLLSQAVEHWQTRAIWVVSRADPEYPHLLKSRLKDDAPPILYGCGEASILETGGLAVVGSRDIDDALVEYTEGIGRLAAKAKRTLVSGGARGIDQAAMRGALDAGGKVAGVLADSFERTALSRDHRNLLLDGQLVLISPYDPAAGFNVGHAMQRNKLIYALADAALVVSSDVGKGGTWTGAVEQLEKLHFVPVYVRSKGEATKGLEALRQKGALQWPNPETTEEFDQALTVKVGAQGEVPEQEQLTLDTVKEPEQKYHAQDQTPKTDVPSPDPHVNDKINRADELFAKVRTLLDQLLVPMTEAEVAAELNVSKGQAKVWLQRLVKEGVLVKLSKPVCYRAAPVSKQLF